MSTASSPPGSRRWWALALIAAAQFMVIMDTSIIGVALPRIQEDLGFSQENLSWVFNAYVVAFGGLLLLGGRLSDLFGARRIFSTGWLILLSGSVVSGVAPTVAVELSGRALQGVGAALIAPSALTLLMMQFGAKPRELTKALALYGAAAPAGGTAGVFLGGVITEYISWPWVFYINIPIAVIALIAAPALMPAGGAGARGSIDVLGALTVTGGIAAAVFAIVRAPKFGWGSAQVWGVLIGAVVLLGIFVAIQASRREPLMRLSIFRTPNLGGANLAQLMLGGAWIPMWFFLNLYLQQVLGYSAFPSGAALLPMTVLIMVGMIGLAPAAINRFGPKAMTVTGLAVLALGMGWLSLIRPAGNYWVDVLPASLVAALGMSLAFIPSLGTAISSARPEEGGLAAGIVNTSYQVGSALGLAAMTAVAASFGAAQLGNLSALTDGFSAAFLGAAAVALAGALLAAVTLRGSRLSPSPSPSEPTPTRVGDELAAEIGEVPRDRVPESDKVTPVPTLPTPPIVAAQPAVVVHWPGPVIYGMVTEGGRTPLAGVTLTLTDLSGRQLDRNDSDTGGHYRLGPPSGGSYLVTCAVAAHQPGIALVVVADVPVRHDFLLSGGGASLSGTVSAAESEQPVAGAIVTLIDVRGDVVATTTTGPDGGFSFLALVQGLYTFTVTATTAHPVARTVDVPAFGDLTHDVEVVGKVKLVGSVRTASAAPVPEAVTTLLDSDGHVVGSAITDTSGEFLFDDLRAGTYTVIATGYPPVATEVYLDLGRRPETVITLRPAALADAASGDGAFDTQQRGGHHGR